MNIGIDLRVLNNKNRTGLGRYTYEITKQILNFQKHNITLIGNECDEFEGGRFQSLKIDVPTVNNELQFANKLLYMYGYIQNFDCLYSPFFPIPGSRDYKTVLTIHDLIPLRMKNLFNNTQIYHFYDTYIRQSAQEVDHIITDSISTRNDVMELFDIFEDKISVVYLGAGISNVKYNQIDNLGILNKYGLSKDNYLLSICTIEPRKNITLLLDAYNEIREKGNLLKLVLVGNIPGGNNSFLKLLNEHKYREDIILTGYIPDKELPVLYKNSNVFIYPSLYEGFGLPILEAMSHGSAVITSNVTSMPEVGGDAVLYINPYDVSSLSEQIDKIINDDLLRMSLKKKAKERSKLFSWTKTAKEILSIFEL